MSSLCRPRVLDADSETGVSSAGFMQRRCQSGVTLKIRITEKSFSKSSRFEHIHRNPSRKPFRNQLPINPTQSICRPSPSPSPSPYPYPSAARLLVASCRLLSPLTMLNICKPSAFQRCFPPPQRRSLLRSLLIPSISLPVQRHRESKSRKHKRGFGDLVSATDDSPAFQRLTHSASARCVNQVYTTSSMVVSMSSPPSSS